LTIASVGCFVPAAPWKARLTAVVSKAVLAVHEDGAAISIVSLLSSMDSRAFCISDGFQAFCKTAIGTLHAHGPTADLTYDGSSLRLIDDDSVLFDSNTAFWDPRSLLGAAAASIAPHDDLAIRALCELIELGIGALYDKGRQAEGIHGEDTFGSAFRRLCLDPDFLLKLVGFGPGSTPAGDDFLAGFLAGRDLLEGGPGLAQAALRTALRTRLVRTTPAGRALLLGALDGVPPAYLVDLMLAAAAWLAERHVQAESRLLGAVEEAMRHGATSGEDALTGFIYALGRSLMIGQ
jgi:hypothetical protein